MGELIDQQEGRPPGQGRVQVEFGKGNTAMFEGTSGKLLQPGQQGGGVGPAVGFHQTDYYVDPFGPLGAGLFQHSEGLADAGVGPEKDLEPPPSRPNLLLADPSE